MSWVDNDCLIGLKVQTGVMPGARDLANQPWLEMTQTLEKNLLLQIFSANTACNCILNIIAYSHRQCSSCYSSKKPLFAADGDYCRDPQLAKIQRVGGSVVPNPS